MNADGITGMVLPVVRARLTGDGTTAFVDGLPDIEGHW
jgi:hypothetical protein